MTRARFVDLESPFGGKIRFTPHTNAHYKVEFLLEEPDGTIEVVWYVHKGSVIQFVNQMRNLVGG